MADESKLPGLSPETVPIIESTPDLARAGAVAPAPTAAAERKAASAGSDPAKTPSAPHQHDSFREFLETIVFVVVLVLILKTFLAEAFVIPTGSMATTLLGYQSEVECEMCKHRFLVNKSKEADPTETRPEWVVRCTCPNCQFVNDLTAPGQPPPPARRGD